MAPFWLKHIYIRVRVRVRVKFRARVKVRVGVRVSDQDKTVNCIINECNKLEQNEYKTRHDWVGKMIH